MDLYNGRALVSVVGFRFLRTRMLGVTVPFHANFDEVNLRFYVRRDLPDGEVRRGVTWREHAPAIAHPSRNWRLLLGLRLHHKGDLYGIYLTHPLGLAPQNTQLAPGGFHA